MKRILVVSLILTLMAVVVSGSDQRRCEYDTQQQQPPPTDTNNNIQSYTPPTTQTKATRITRTTTVPTTTSTRTTTVPTTTTTDQPDYHPIPSAPPEYFSISISSLTAGQSGQSTTFTVIPLEGTTLRNKSRLSAPGFAWSSNLHAGTFAANGRPVGMAGSSYTITATGRSYGQNISQSWTFTLTTPPLLRSITGALDNTPRAKTVKTEGASQTQHIKVGLNVIGFPEIPALYKRPSDLLVDGITCIIVTNENGFSIISRKGDKGDDLFYAGQGVILCSTAVLQLDLSAGVLAAPAAPRAYKILNTSWGAIKRGN